MIADIIIIAVLALSIFLGYKKGLIELGISLCAVVIAIAATLILYRPITNLIINTTNLDETIENKIVENLSIAEQDGEGENSIQGQIQNEILPTTAREISISIIRTGVMLILYIVIRIALRLVTALANLVAKLPILEQFNEIGGIIFGAIRGIALIYIVLLIISFVGQVNSTNVIHKEIDKSIIAKEMYKNNIISLLIK